MNESEKLLSERMLLDFLRGLDERFVPLKVRLLETEKTANNDRRIDALVEVMWDDSRFVFAVETGLQFNPKAIETLVERATNVADQIDVSPMILTPYLSENQLRVLETRQVSGIDMCGNGVIIVPERLLVYRTGNQNRYPSSSPIRNVYRGTSSIVARAFLLRSRFETSQDLFSEINARAGEITLSTISKVCSSLADDLIIERIRQGRTTQLRLLQPEKLLERLVANYAPPEPRRRFVGKISLEGDDLDKVLSIWSTEEAQRVIRTGATSTSRYATMAREPISRYYCTDVGALANRLGEAVSETDRFPNFELLETDDATVYFDPREGFDASPIQSYLELASGDKRERETAEQVRQRLLEELSPSGSGK